MKQKLLTEEHNSKLNDLKIQDQWRQAMRSQKMQELLQSIEVLKAVHKRQVDRKNAILTALDKDVGESEEQHRNAMQAHFMNVDNLIQMQTDRISDLEKDFNRQVKELQNEFQVEK
jgi:tRNA U34 5-carboxymethylaminomethyl modifying enzyme MnmG/GidA